MMPAHEPQLGEMQSFFSLEWLTQALLDQVGQSGIVVALAPGSIRPPDPDFGIRNPLNTQRDSRPDRDLLDLYLRTIKEGTGYGWRGLCRFDLVHVSYPRRKSDSLAHDINTTLHRKLCRGRNYALC